MPNIEQHNLRQMINNHFFDRDQTKEILENFVTVDNNSVLHVGLPEPANVALTTPNNAITTADVGTLKAKVTDSNSNNCYGVPVDFVNRKTREVIGQGITDLNGEAYYNFRLEDSDIFSVQAKLSQDYLFHDGAILNNTATWGNSGNIVQEIYHDYTLIYKDDDSLDSLLYSPVLSGYTEISFKAKLVDAAASDSFCGLIETNSSGTVTGTLNGITLSQLGLTDASNGQWYKFYINVLGTDVFIKAVNLDTKAVSTASVTLSAAMSYFSFCFVLTGDLTTTYFSDVKINKCSDDLTMFVKEKRNLCGVNLWSGTDYLGIVSAEKDDNIQFSCSKGFTNVVSSNEWSSNFEKSIKSDLSAGDYTVFFKYNLDRTKSYTGSVDVTSQCHGILYLIARDQPNSTNTILKSASFAPSTTTQTITARITSDEFTGSETQLQLRIANNTSGIIYTDNWKLLYE